MKLRESQGEFYIFLGTKWAFLQSTDISEYVYMKQRIWTKSSQIRKQKCNLKQGLAWCLSGKESVCQRRRHRFDPWVRKIHWRSDWQLTPVFLAGKSLGQRSLVGYSLCGCKNSDMTQQLNNNHIKNNSYACTCNQVGSEIVFFSPKEHLGETAAQATRNGQSMGFCSGPWLCLYPGMFLRKSPSIFRLVGATTAMAGREAVMQPGDPPHYLGFPPLHTHTHTHTHTHSNPHIPEK